MLEARTKGRLTLLVVAALFLGPLAGAYLLYFGGSGWRPAETTEHGELLTALPVLSEAALVENGAASPSFRGKWSLVYVNDGECGEACQAALYQTRQVHRALGKDRDRVQRVFCLTADAADRQHLQREHPDLILLEADLVAGREFMAAIAGYPFEDIFLVDPLGNIMMRFPQDTGMKGIHADVKKLLKISRIG